MSVRESTGSPRTCSGDMYPGVPSTEPVRVASPPGVTVASMMSRGPARTSSTSFAIPKSSSFTCPLAVGLTLEELGDEVRRTVVNAHVVERHDVGMVERAGDPCLLLEAAHEIR